MTIRHASSSPLNLPSEPSVREVELRLELDVEPWLFAGGPLPRHRDPVQAVRPTSILGQLRTFWRRLLPESECTTVGQLRSAESRVFGAASEPGPFRIEVDVIAQGKCVPVPAIGRPGGYVTFAGRAQRDPPTRAADLVEGVRAVVAIRGDLKEGVLEALRAWAILGGVGGRTRRGLGAVQVRGLVSDRSALDSLIHEIFDRGPRGPKCGGKVRSIAEVWRTDRVSRSAFDCLVGLEKWYRGYRQDRRPGPGRSYWDEPELIRQKTVRAKKNEPLPTPFGRRPAGWSRSVLGLPIVFHFKDAGDPPPTSLEGPKGIQRSSSPLLFRPVRVGERKYVGVVAWLSAPYFPPGGLYLVQGRHGQRIKVEIPANPTAVWSDLVAAGQADPDLQLVKVV